MSTVAAKPVSMNFGQVQRKSEGQQTSEEICSRYLVAIDNAASARGDEEKAEALSELDLAKQALLGVLRSQPCRRISLLGCVFHLHWQGKKAGVSVHRKLARLRKVVPALIRSF